MDADVNGTGGTPLHHDQGQDGQPLAVDELHFVLAEPVGGELAARAPSLFALAEVEARRRLAALLAGDAGLRAALSGRPVEIDELVVPLRIVVDGKTDDQIV